MFIKHKPRLYFDENFPVEAIEHFRSHILEEAALDYQRW
jgi:hypothetical protein